MSWSRLSPRRVTIGDAASFAGTTPRAIRHYHAIGLLPEPERSGDGRRRYGYDDMIRLLWVRKTADAGIALDVIRDAFADAPPAAGAPAVTDTGSAADTDTDTDTDNNPADGDHDVAGILGRLERSLLDQEAELRRQRAAVQRMRTRGSRMGLLSDVVSDRLEHLPAGSLRQDDLDTLLVTERVFSPLGAAVQAGRFVVLATHPALRAESDRVDAAEEALDDTVAVDDPRVAQVAADRHAVELALHAVIEASGQDEEDDALFEAWDALHPPTVDGGEDPPEDEDRRAGGHGSGREPRSVVDALGMMPYDFSPARLRCMELVEELAAREDA